MNFDDLLNDAAGSELAKVDSNALPSNVAGEMTKASAGESLVQMFDRTKQTIFCIDVSYSQAGAIAQNLKEVDYTWPDNFEEYCRKLRRQYHVRQEARDAVKRGVALDKLSPAAQAAFHYVVPRVFADMKDGEESKWREMYSKSGLGVGTLVTSMYVLEFEDATGGAKMGYWTNPPMLKPNAARMVKNKLDAVKTAGTLIIEKRFAKYGRSAVSVMLFSDDVYTYTFPYAQYGNNGLAVRDAAIQKIRDANLLGGTDIMRALRAAIKIAADSGQKGHHVLLCTDGADMGAASAMDLLPDFQEHGIMLDFILVLGIQEEEESDPARDALTKLCLATNGAFQTVTSEEEMVLKLTDAHTRLALPPAPPKLSDGKEA